MRAIVPWDVGSYPYAEINYANPHAVTSVGGTTYTYDNNGNVTAIGSLDYTWDRRNRLASAERSGGGNTTYGYDHTGQRVFQATGSATTSYPNRYYNVASSSLSATTTKHIFSPDGTLLATVVGASTTASTTYLHPDHLGGTNVVTDEDGAVTQTLDYYPYGSQRITSGSFDEQRRFIGEEFDGDTEFSYLNARYYQGSRGQFMSQDPVFLLIGDAGRVKAMTQQELVAILTDPQVLNSYSYARNNPLILKDPSGEFNVITFGYWALQAFSYSLLSIEYYFLQRELGSDGEWSRFDREAMDDFWRKAGTVEAVCYSAGGACEVADFGSELDQLAPADPVRTGDGGSAYVRQSPQIIVGPRNEFGWPTFLLIPAPPPPPGSSGGGGLPPPPPPPSGPPTGSSGGTGINVWAVLRAAISQYFSEGGN